MECEIERRAAETLSEKATTFIFNAIARGGLKPGARISEQEVAERLQISRGPVREAIRGLIARGLLTFEPNVGARVITLDDEFLNDLYEVRAKLEGLAARLAAERMSEEERETLQSVLAEHERELADQPLGAYPPQSRLDQDFHMLILKGARNQMIWRICGQDLRDLLVLARRQHAVRAERGRNALREHKRIAEAIAEGNGDLAELLMVQHIQASRQNLLAGPPRGDFSRNNRRNGG